MPSLLNDSFSLTVSRSIFAKRPIKVVVGSEERVYYVHHGALEAHPAFEAQLKEATDDYMYHVNWSAYDEQTVECALGFLYTGGYEAPEATSEVEVVEEAEAEAGEEAPAEEEVEEAEEVEEGRMSPKTYSEIQQRRKLTAHQYQLHQARRHLIAQPYQRAT